MSPKIDRVYKMLVRKYAYKYSEPLHMLNADITAMQSKGKSRERAVLELALQAGFRPREYLGFLHEEGGCEEEAISKFLENEVLGISDSDSEIKEIIGEANRSKLLNPFDEKGYQIRGEPSKAWYLVPFFFSIIGGLIGYVGVKDEDKGMANNLLLVGILMFFLNIVALWMVFS